MCGREDKEAAPAAAYYYALLVLVSLRGLSYSRESLLAQVLADCVSSKRPEHKGLHLLNVRCMWYYLCILPCIHIVAGLDAWMAWMAAGNDVLLVHGAVPTHGQLLRARVHTHAHTHTPLPLAHHSNACSARACSNSWARRLATFARDLCCSAHASNASVNASPLIHRRAASELSSCTHAADAGVRCYYGKRPYCAWLR